MMEQAEFDIKASGPISKAFSTRNINSFSEASRFIKTLPYGRNKNKNELVSVFKDGCGTCSTKHALLQELALENDFKDLKLTLGLFKMNGINTPTIYDLLKQNQLEYIPEAHCYLKYNDQILDFTKLNSKPSDFVNDLIEEIEISPSQIVDFKIDYHQKHLKSWLESQKEPRMSLNELWKLREQCIEKI